MSMCASTDMYIDVTASSAALVALVTGASPTMTRHSPSALPRALPPAPKLQHAPATHDASDTETNLLAPATSSNVSAIPDNEDDEPLMLIGSPVRPQDKGRWIDVGDSEDEEEG